MTRMPVLEMVTAFKSIHVLNDVLKSRTDENGKAALKASHYCCVLIGGPQPVWGVWTIGGKFIMFAPSRSWITAQYPGKSWTRVMASWLLTDAEGNYKDIAKRVRALEERYGGHIDRDPEHPGTPGKSNKPAPIDA